MNLLILGDIMGASGRKALTEKLPNLIKTNKIDFVIVNGENASDDGRGITQEISLEFLKLVLMLLPPEIIFGIKKRQQNSSKKKIDF